VAVWVHLDWDPPSCLSLKAGQYRFVAAVAGPVPAADDAELLARVGAISKTIGTRYWSTTEQAWRVLIEDASALAGADGGRRQDFTLAEMRSGQPLYFAEKDNRTPQPTTYRMQVVKAAADELVVESTNVTPVEAFGMTLLPPESLRFAYLARRKSAREWNLYLLSAADGNASRLVGLGKESYVNRARAIFSHIAQVLPDETARP